MRCLGRILIQMVASFREERRAEDGPCEDTEKEASANRSYPRPPALEERLGQVPWSLQRSSALPTPSSQTSGPSTEHKIV